jgi:catechol 2,3-dioxygenase-like lactoylglutathione lyase family enzyme
MVLRLSLGKILVFAPDLQVARQFYGEALGLELAHEAETRLSFRGSDFELTVFACERPTRSEGYSREAGSSVAFAVPSLDAAIPELSARGVRFLHDSPQEGPLGRYVALTDPFGTVHELVEVGGADGVEPRIP